MSLPGEQMLPLDVKADQYMLGPLKTMDDQGRAFGPGWLENGREALTERFLVQETATPWLRHGRD